MVVNNYVLYRIGRQDALNSRRPPRERRRQNGHSVLHHAESYDTVDGPVDDRLDGVSAGVRSETPAVQRRLGTNGFHRPEDDDELEPEFKRVLLALTAEFEQRYEEAFQTTCDELFLTPDNAQMVFMTTINSLFANNVINWGRIVALLAFSGAAAAQCVDKELPYLVDSIVAWTTAFINQRLASWIEQNGGWNGLVSFYGSGTASSSWPSLRALCGCAMGALGVLTLGAIMAQK